MSDALSMGYPVRHRATAWTQTGQHTDGTDLAFNARGKREALDLSTRLCAERGNVLILTHREILCGFRSSASPPSSKEHK